MRNKRLPPRVFIPLILFVIGCAITGILSELFVTIRNGEIERSFENKSNQITSLVDNRMSLYSNVLFGAQGLFAASTHVDELEWKSYVSTLNLKENYRGISSMLFIKEVPAAEVGTLPFKIYPYQEKSEYFPITYIASAVISTSSSIGFDISSEAGRRSALLAASSTKKPSATPVVQSAGVNPIPVFSIYLPVFEGTTTQQNAVGYVSATFRVKELFEGLAADPLFDRNIDVKIIDPDGAILLDTSASRSLTPTYSGRIYEGEVIVGGKTWVLEYKALSSFSLGTFSDILPLLILILGLFLTGLLSLISYLFIVSRERAIASRSLQLDTLIRNFPYGVLVENEERVVLYANQRVLDLFTNKVTTSLTQLIGANMRDLEHATQDDVVKDSPALRKSTQQIIAANKIIVNEKILLQGGKVISRDYVPLFSNGERMGAIWIYKDVTEEENIDRMKTEFVSLASHQLRTPLTSIKWYTELLMTDASPLDEEQAEYAKEIHEAADRMNDLVVALLDISRLDLGTFIIEPTSEDLIKLMQTAVDEQKPTIEKKQQVFSFNHPDTLEPVLVDKKLAFIIVQNLVSNAMKYSPEKAHIDLSLSKVAAGYEIKCADTGFGIPQKDQANIFKKLFRADNIRTLDVEGTGLGLYMIKTIAEAAGCTIAFTSEEGKGTTFIFTIPSTGMKPKAGTKTLGE